jgi:DedD protein
MFKQKSDAPAPATRVEPGDAVQAARTRARQRLIGAIVLLAVGIIGFPLVFETQPRPVPIDIPIEIPRREAVPPLAMPQSRLPAAVPASPAPPAAARAGEDTAGGRAGPSREPVPIESRADAGRDVTPPRAATTPERAASRVAAAPAAPAASRVAAAPAPASAAEPARRASAVEVARRASAVEPSRRASAPEPARRASAPVLASRGAAAPASAAQADADRARDLLEGQASASAEGARFVLQVGAFADAEAARDTRKQVEKLGLKTYTQVAQTAAGSRIRVRVGPFSSRGEADAALAKAKAAGLAAVVLTL